MDLVPTTGAAITVKYGPAHETRITRTDGSVSTHADTACLEEYAVLNEQRQMRADIADVEVYCPHPLLKLGIELVDLPGTDDAIAQDDLVQKQLLSADVVIQLLDGRKLMTLAERENLRDWLLDRGIETVIFVVNFLNLMESGDRQQVALRLRFLAESFRSNLPTGVSNLYQVDALPALRARLKGDSAAAAQTGLSELESALQTIGQQSGAGQLIDQSASRLKVLANSVLSVLCENIKQLSEPDVEDIDAQKLDIKKRAQALIQQGFERDIAKLRAWLAVNNLQANYRLGLADALREKAAQSWLVDTLQPAWETQKQPVVSWVHQASEIFEVVCPADMQMGFAAQPVEAVKPVDTAQTPEDTSSSDVANKRTADEGGGIGPVAIATGLGWILGGPLGAAVLGGTSHLINESNRSEKPSQKPKSKLENKSEQQIDYAAQADIYLSRFSMEALEAVNSYEHKARTVIQMPLGNAQPAQSAAQSAIQSAQLNLLQSTVSELLTLSESLP